MSWFRNAIANLYDAVSAPIAAAHNALSKRLGAPDFDAFLEGHVEIAELCE